ncbi:MAG TPA: DUF1028 domain-containing protein [Stellaceae bacterium]|nr:DUF1028 domain-containing protein [Stellaceae bacterium]
MTWSIIARDAQTGEFGIAVATRFFAVGALCPHGQLRVDDHAEPLTELERLLMVAREYYIHFRAFLPTRAAPAGAYDRAVINREITRVTRR